MTNANGRVAITLAHPDISDAAWDIPIDDAVDGEHAATISPETLSALQAAQEALDANPDWHAVIITAAYNSPTLKKALRSTEDWATNTETFHLDRDAHLSLRLSDCLNCEASVEYDVRAANGARLTNPA